MVPEGTSSKTEDVADRQPLACRQVMQFFRPYGTVPLVLLSESLCTLPQAVRDEASIRRWQSTTALTYLIMP